MEARGWFEKEVLGGGQPWTPTITSKLTKQLERQVILPPKVDWLALAKQVEDKASMNALMIAGTGIHQDQDGRFSLNDFHRAAGGEMANWVALRSGQKSDRPQWIVSGWLFNFRIGRN